MTKKILFFLSLLLFLLIFLGIPVRIHAGEHDPKYLELDGGYVKTVSNQLKPPAGFTIEAWINPKSVSGIQNIISIGDSQGNPHYGIAINGGSLSFVIRYDNGSIKLLSGGQIPAGDWTHIAASIDASTMEIFIRGQKVNSMSGVGNLPAIGETIILGDSFLESPFSSNKFIGSIDDVRISFVKRDIAALWNTPSYYALIASDPNTLLFWHLNETRGETIAKDASSNKLDGTLIGSDSQIHFYGVLPTPTPWSFTLPTIRWTRPVLPTLYLPGFNQPVQPPPDDFVLPTSAYSRPTFSRPSRPSR